MASHAFGRNSRRYRIILPFQAWLQDRLIPQVTSGWTSNLGEAGACLELSSDLIEGYLPGSQLFLTLQLDHAEDLPLEAQVVWVGQPSSPGGTRHGVIFPQLNPDQRQRLRDLIRRLGQSWQNQGAYSPGQRQRDGSNRFRMHSQEDLGPWVPPEYGRDRLAQLLQVRDTTLGDLLWGKAEAPVTKHGLDWAMVERDVTAFDAGGALSRVEMDSPPRLAELSQANVDGIDEEGLRDESSPHSSGPQKGFWSLRRYAVWAGIGLFLLAGGLGLLGSQGVLRIPGFNEPPPNTQTEKLSPNVARPKVKTPASASRSGDLRNPVR
jgi:hypothetical protein